MHKTNNKDTMSKKAVIKDGQVDIQTMINNLLHQSPADDDLIEWLIAYDDYKVNKTMRPQLYQLIKHALNSHSILPLFYEDMLPISQIISYGIYPFVNGDIVGFEPDTSVKISHVIIFISHHDYLSFHNLKPVFDKIQAVYGEDSIFLFGTSTCEPTNDMSISIFAYKL